MTSYRVDNLNFTDSETDGQTNLHRQRKYPFSLKDQWVKSVSGNYRPVSLTSILSKVMEGIMRAKFATWKKTIYSLKTSMASWTEGLPSHSSWKPRTLFEASEHWIRNWRHIPRFPKSTFLCTTSQISKKTSGATGSVNRSTIWSNPFSKCKQKIIANWPE